LQILDKADIKPSSRSYNKTGVMTAGANESSWLQIGEWSAKNGSIRVHARRRCVDDLL